MGDQGEPFADMAHRLVQALDAWATCVGEPTAEGKPTRKALVKALETEREMPVWQSRKKIDQALLSYWLKGRKQLLPGTKHNRLPSEEDCAAIARALKEKAPENAQRLPKIGWEIADLARSLQDAGGPGWRNRVLTSVIAQPDELVEPVEAANPAEPVDSVELVEPAGAAGPAEVAERRVRRRRWKNGRVWGVAAVVAVAAAGTIALFVWPGGGDSASAGKKPDGSAAPSAQVADVAKPVPAASTESGGVKGNHRCGKARSAGAVSWTPCTLVTEDGATSFLVQFANTSGKPVTVKARLAYVQAAAEQTCPDPWGTSVTVTVPAGATKTSPLDTCTVSLTPAQAFQARVWVVPDGAAQWGYREHSPTLHVQNDGTPVWADEA
ncbi:hypothetical protein OIE62_21940 [Streptomyces scopuliridis]|uniref:Uncharacterized protein n=1 Tax=Streptomyces scopuliridis TaxID=452529 RepID=A0ACD4ZKC6_9ACTN|nr:hypothetical protein [Streptomyces scopuliridis]WSB98900.1 hypothetical protein OG835_19005 [Streptomyces scopuliridis]WSC07398.1 hypothetical protein OIE62_21940 [Streptomyces scopuliridis]